MEDKEIIFSEIYNKIRKKYYIEYEERRKKGKFYWTISIILVFAALCFFSLAGDYEVSDFEGSTRGIFFVISFVSLCIAVKMFKEGDKQRNYNEEYKNTVIREFIKNINPELSYILKTDNKKEIYKEYQKAGFNHYTYDLCNIDDYIKGSLNEDINVEVYDIADQIEIKKENGENKYPTIFSGLFAIIKLSKDKEMKIKILDKKTVTDKKQEFIKMDYKNFEENFNVIAENNIYAYQILTHDVMELLLQYKNRYNINFDISFMNNVIYYRFHTGPMFEAALNEEGMRIEVFYKYYIALELIREFSQKVYKIYLESNI